jgi:hypothetical protein
MRSLIAASLVMFAVCVAAVKPWPPGQKPAFCNQQDCPVFETIFKCSARNFTVRRYPAQQWVAINFTGAYAADDYKYFGPIAFPYLFKYITGANVAGAQINMTDPVPIDIFSGLTPTCNSTFRVSFFIPFGFQGIAPQPTDPQVYLRTSDEMIVVQRSFPGFADSWKTQVQPQFQALATSIEGTGIQVENLVETVSEYDGPYQFFDRHNEAWFYVTNGNNASTWKC